MPQLRDGSGTAFRRDKKRIHSKIYRALAISLVRAKNIFRHMNTHHPRPAPSPQDFNALAAILLLSRPDPKQALPLPPRALPAPPWQHVGQGFPLDWFTHTFNKLSVAMSILAVAMGPAVTVAHDLAGGPLGPFKISLILTGINGFLLFSWRRDSNKAPPACGDIGRLASHAWSAVVSGDGGGGGGNKVALVAAAQGCFEAATFAFALLWTPLLMSTGTDAPQQELPWGIVFSQQLVSCRVPVSRGP